MGQILAPERVSMWLQGPGVQRHTPPHTCWAEGHFSPGHLHGAFKGDSADRVILCPDMSAAVNSPTVRAVPFILGGLTSNLSFFPLVLFIFPFLTTDQHTPPQQPPPRSLPACPCSAQSEQLCSSPAHGHNLGVTMSLGTSGQETLYQESLKGAVMVCKG